ncbi:MAG: ABC transporter substrate-binding protein [Pseudomonadota bacterium]
MKSLTIVLLCFCSFAFSSTTSAKLRLSLNWKPEPEFGGFYEAALNGFYEKEGIELEILPGGVGTPVIQMVEAGKVEMGISNSDEVILGRSQGAEVVSIYAVYQTSPMALLTHAERGFKELKDVFESPGTIAAERGLPYIRFCEKKYGFKNVKIVPFMGGITQFLSDKKMTQQGFMTAEPILARKQGANPKTFLIADSGYNPYLTVVIVRKEFAAKNPDLIKKFVKATQEGWRRYLENPSAANKKMAVLNPTMDSETFQEGAKAQIPLIETAETKKFGLGYQSKERWEKLASQLLDLKVVKSTLPAEAYFQ